MLKNKILAVFCFLFFFELLCSSSAAVPLPAAGPTKPPGTSRAVGSGCSVRGSTHPACPRGFPFSLGAWQSDPGGSPGGPGAGQGLRLFSAPSAAPDGNTGPLRLHRGAGLLPVRLQPGRHQRAPKGKRRAGLQGQEPGEPQGVPIPWWKTPQNTARGVQT